MVGMKSKTPQENKWCVYMTRGSDGSLYTGVSIDVERRIRQHNGEGKRGAKSLRSRRPVVCVYRQEFPTRSEALKRELEIKKMKRGEKVLLLDNFEL
jgi:putative endonuclease